MQIEETEIKEAFVVPTKPEDFKVKKIVDDVEVEESVNKIEHTYENGNSVVFLLLKDGRIARVREGSGEDVDLAEIECGEDKNKYMASMMASTITIDGSKVNMYDLPKQLKMKDYLFIKTEFANLNF